MYSLNGYSKSTPPQNRRITVSISDSQQQVDDFVAELTFQNHLINAFCEIRALDREAGALHQRVGVREPRRLSGAPPSYLPTYLLTYLRTYLPSYLPTYVPTYLPAW